MFGLELKIKCDVFVFERAYFAFTILVCHSLTGTKVYSLARCFRSIVQAPTFGIKLVEAEVERQP